MTIDRGGRTAVSDGIPVAEGQDLVRPVGGRIGRPGALDLLRTLVIVALAIFAILVLLPAVVAAQAAVAI